MTRRSLLLALVFTGLLLVVGAPVASANVITVDSLADDNPAAPAVPGCSLREAVAAANTNAAVGGCTAGGGADEIKFSVNGTFQITLGPMVISENLTITGNGPTNTDLMSVGAPSPVLNRRIFQVGVNVATSISGVTMRNGNVIDSRPGIAAGSIPCQNLPQLAGLVQDPGSPQAGRGGAIFNLGHLKVTNSVLRDNVAAEVGGAIYSFSVNNAQADAAIADTTFTGNRVQPTGAVPVIQDSALGGAVAIDNCQTASGGNHSVLAISRGLFTNNLSTTVGGSGIGGSGSGGAIWFGGDVTDVSITESTFRANNAGGSGGAINAFGRSLLIDRSTFEANVADGDGGGIAALAIQNTITNSTISGNSGGFGGGIIATLSVLTLTHSTVAFNTATLDGGGLQTIQADHVLRANIISNNTSPSVGPNCAVVLETSIVSNGFNLSNDDTCQPLFTNPTDRINVNPQLKPLADNGGPTRTHALPTASIAVDFVTSGCPPPATDQRGITRPQDGNGDGTVLCDSGAYELAPGTLQFSASTYTVNEGAGTAAITITRTGGTDGAVSATLTLTDGSATAPADYNNTPIVVSFANGENSKTVQVPIVDDTLVEANETVNLALTNPTGAASIGTPATAVLTIQDNDAAPATGADLSITKTGPASVDAGSNAVYTLTVTNNGPAQAENVSVQDPAVTGLTFVSTSGACATAFPCALGSLPPGQSRTITATFNISTAYNGPSPLINTAAVGSSTADPNTANNTASAQTKVQTPYVAPPEDNQDKQSPQHKQTEEQQQQQQLTNTSGHDDVHTGGHVIGVATSEDGKTLLVTIKTIDPEPLVVEVPCPGGNCPDIRVGDEITADGWQGGKDEHGHFIASDGVTVERNGKAVK